MSNDRKLVVALLGVVVVLLSLSFGRAMGQAQPDPPGLGDAPIVPVALSANGNRIYRMWSDGSVDSTHIKFFYGPGPPSALHHCIVQTTCTDQVID